MASLEEAPQDWKCWFSSDEPEHATLPGQFVFVQVFLRFATLRKKNTLNVLIKKSMG